MNDVTIARSIAWGRIGFGLLMLIAPNSVLARTATERPGPLVWMARAFGIRDLVLGAGAVVALAQPEPDASWVKMGAIADSCDAVAAVVWRDELVWSEKLTGAKVAEALVLFPRPAPPAAPEKPAKPEKKG